MVEPIKAKQNKKLGWAYVQKYKTYTLNFFKKFNRNKYCILFKNLRIN